MQLVAPTSKQVLRHLSSSFHPEQPSKEHKLPSGQCWVVPKCCVSHQAGPTEPPDPTTVRERVLTSQPPKVPRLLCQEVVFHWTYFESCSLHNCFENNQFK